MCCLHSKHICTAVWCCGPHLYKVQLHLCEGGRDATRILNLSKNVYMSPVEDREVHETRNKTIIKQRKKTFIIFHSSTIRYRYALYFFFMNAWKLYNPPTPISGLHSTWATSSTMPLPGFSGGKDKNRVIIVSKLFSFCWYIAVQEFSLRLYKEPHLPKI